MNNETSGSRDMILKHFDSTQNNQNSVKLEHESSDNNESSGSQNFVFNFLMSQLQNMGPVEIKQEVEAKMLDDIEDEYTDNNYNEGYSKMDTDGDLEWEEEFKKLNKDPSKMDKREQERHRQMAKNREYARKCVQKKKDQRKHAEIRSNQIKKRIQLLKNKTAIKEKNANFAVDLRKMMSEIGVERLKLEYENEKMELNKKFAEMFAQDETVNLNFHRLASAREEFEKAAEDLRLKNGVIGTLGSRKIRAKQQMEWRQHLYQISAHEHEHHRETKLAELADEYVKQTVPKAAPLVTSIPKDMLDQLIKNNKTLDLEELCRFVADNLCLLQNDNDDKESVVK
ncbi:BZIP domain-containing protein [Caenorhabditis elegans]|uniref:BZIP domain-containing protein n=1 Tax=Caenorhabditis elegans TaxID=6239 RepID=Q9XW80_CAEEL|nr:BZIP domain-containing protein [Caenorhabditis elegans]CAA22089.1 BZIP domain-containing protein [Caenorhabditis elegans]|eukprot:NP_499601.1 bZIP transcription factor family [Caenorhabditis elegans]